MSGKRLEYLAFDFLQTEDVRLQFAGVAGETGDAPVGVEMGGIDTGVEVGPDVCRGEDVSGGEGKGHWFIAWPG